MNVYETEIELLQYRFKSQLNHKVHHQLVFNSAVTHTVYCSGADPEVEEGGGRDTDID